MENWTGVKLMQKRIVGCLIFIALFCTFAESLSEPVTPGGAEIQKVLGRKNFEEEDYYGIGERRKLLERAAGSSPPRCETKCGECTPCELSWVQIPPPPGFNRLMTEYYPEHWKCSCGGKIYKAS
ncbi:OLC1v1006420C1 [Oldenlandia corymbosa var. corymbosa]|uniref:Epidermal patterning factor-like protein n=1 Tax=Oldenlandia corymbosa var. corymbosa TaxID=529605 RepID=A0AAV1DGZ3_OLDCO|nr:OLC1v1006420C1 [Oldenlandia corymbosa var. corymbosa]